MAGDGAAANLLQDRLVGYRHGQGKVSLVLLEPWWRVGLKPKGVSIAAVEYALA